jgi:hypothetical protein
MKNDAMFDLIPAAELLIDQPGFKAGVWRPATIRGERWETSQCFERVGGKWEGFVAIRKARGADRTARIARGRSR